MSKKRTNPDFLNGVPELVILQLLKRKPMYGYELVQTIEQVTGSTLQFGEGCVYPLLHKLEKQRVLASRREVASGRSRVVYRLTPAGKKKLAHSVEHWYEIVQAVGCLLKGVGNDQPQFSPASS